MPQEPNGSGPLDRVEALLAQMVERQATSTWLHAQRLQEHEQRHAAYEERMTRIETSVERVVARIDNLVVAIGQAG